MPRVSPFSSAFAQTPSAPEELDRILAAIKGGKWEKEITTLRGLKGEEYKKRKVKLAGFKASGVFHSKADEGLVEHSGIVQIDIDHSLNPDTPYRELWNKTLGMPSLYAAFRSPSGKGVKALIRCNPDRNTHAGSYLAAADWFSDRGVAVDRQVCALSQLCFCSWDSDLYINRKAKVIVPVEVTPADSQLTEYEEERTDGEILKACEVAWPGVFPDLWEGNIDGQDHSTCDHQLITILRENCFSSERVAELFHQSGLYRPKKHSGKTREYVFRSLTKCNTVQALAMLDVIPEDPDDPSPVKKRKAGGWTWETAYDIPDWAPEDDKYIIKRLLYESSVNCVYGAPGSGKTFCVFSLAAAVASGIEWHGHKVKRGAVMYFGLEAKEGVKKRIQAMKKEGHLTEENSKLFARVHFKPDSLNLLSEDHVEKACKLAEAYEKECGHKLRILIIDTLARATPGGDENSTQDMGLAVVNAQAIADRLHCAVLIIHHSNKLGHIRGSTALPAAFDSVYEVTRNEVDPTIREFAIRKARDEGDMARLHFRLRIIELGLDLDLEEVTTCLLEFLEDRDIPVKREKGDIDRAALLGSIPEEGATADQIAEETGIARSTVQRKVKLMLEEGVLRKGNDGKFCIIPETDLEEFDPL